MIGEAAGKARDAWIYGFVPIEWCTTAGVSDRPAKTPAEIFFSIAMILKKRVLFWKPYPPPIFFYPPT
jgi:hypothetical protein